MKIQKVTCNIENKSLIIQFFGIKNIYFFRLKHLKNIYIIMHQKNFFTIHQLFQRTFSQKMTN